MKEVEVKGFSDGKLELALAGEIDFCCLSDR